jgi:hypothetical protein
MSPLGQAHMPLWHVLPFMQALPHMPQLLLSEFRSAQVMLCVQKVCPDGHMHEPVVPLAWHVSPPTHVVPHAPQLELSVDRLVHSVGFMVGHIVGLLIGHLQPVPLAQIPFFKQAFPQAPQF